MASSDYDSGIGGKFRKRPYRIPSTTPYDRPQTTIRRTNPNPNTNGWISKIVDPASRIIYRGASKLFSSVFQKRLTASPPQAQEENGISRRVVPDAVHNLEKPADEALEAQDNSGDNAVNNYGINETPCTEGLFELEQLLKQKTFTRAEFDRLTDLLRSRTVEPSASNLQIDNETKEEVVVTEHAKHNQEEPCMSQPVVTCERVENALISEQDRMKCLNLHGNISKYAVNLHDEAVPPEEIAKAYMDSRPSKVSPSTLSVRSRVLEGDSTLPTVSYTKKRSLALLDSRYSIPFAGSSEHSENGYITPKPRGRSALYKMSRSPYFKVHAATNSRGGIRARDDGLASPSSSLSSKFMLSRSRQVLKRGSSVLVNDFGSFGPIRRTRQKSLLMSPSERDSSPSCTTSLGRDAGNGNSTNPFATFGHVPAQSTEMAMKIFQELGRLVPSPSEKLSEKKGSGNSYATSDSPLPSLRSSISPKQNIKENEPSQDAVAAVKSTCEDGAVGNSVTSAAKVKFGREIDGTPLSFSGATSQKEPAVQATVVQESFELDASNTGCASGALIAGSDKFLDQSLASSSNSLHSISVMKGKVDVKGFDKPTNEKRVDFMSSGALSLSSGPSSMAAISPPSASEGCRSTTPSAAVREGPGSDKGGRTQKVVDMQKLFGNATSSGLSTSSVLFNLGASTTTNQSNGFLTSASSSFPASAMTVSGTAPSSSSSMTAAEPVFTSTPLSSSVTPPNGIFGFSSSEQSSSRSLSYAQNNFSTSKSVSGGTVGSVFDPQPTQSGIGTTSCLHHSTVQSTSFASVPVFGSNAMSSLSSGFSPSSFAPTAAANLFSSSSQPPSSTFTTTLGSIPSLPSTGFSFGSPASTATNFSSSVGACPAPVFSSSAVSTSTSPASPLPAQPIFGTQRTQATDFSTDSPGNYHTNVEDCMTDDNVQAAARSAPIFGRPSNSLSNSSCQFGKPAGLLGPSAFQFGNPQNSTVPQNPSPVQAAGSSAVSARGSVSLGSTNGDKSARRIVRVKRDKRPKK